MADEIVTTGPVDLTLSPKQSLDVAKHNFTAIAKVWSDLLRCNLSDEETALFHEHTSKVKEDAEAFKDILRERLLNILTTKGSKVTEKGSLQIALGEGRVQRATPTRTTPVDKLVEAKVRSKGLAPEAWMDRIITYKVNEAKFKELVDTGLFTKDDAQACYGKQSYRIGKTSAAGENDE